MAKLNSWTDRQATAFADEDEDLFLRPEAPATPQRSRKATAAKAREEDAETFLRTRRRIAPRKTGRLRVLAGSRFGRILLVCAVAVIFVSVGAVVWGVDSFLRHNENFQLASADHIKITGSTEANPDAVRGVFAADLRRDVFSVPLRKREAVLELQPWVKHATVMRVLPSTILVAIEERVPVAFVRIGRQIELVDKEGVILNMSPATMAARHYSFPVVTGLDPKGTPDSRAARMHLFMQFSAALAAGEVNAQLSEVNLGDLDDVQAIVPAQGTDLLLHFGNTDFLERYQSYERHLAEWRQQYPNLSAVDLRYDRQVVLKMADRTSAGQGGALEASPPAASAHKAALSTHTAIAGTTHHTVAHKATAIKGHESARKKAHHKSHWKARFIPHAGRAD